MQGKKMLTSSLVRRIRAEPSKIVLLSAYSGIVGFGRQDLDFIYGGTLMNSKMWVRKALSTSLMISVLASSSMFALAGEAPAAGELYLTNKSDVASVNGENAPNGRTFFTSTSIVTSEKNGATLNLGKAGMIELEPNTSLVVSFDQRAVRVELLAGSITNLRSLEDVNVSTITESFSLKQGGSASLQTNDKYDREDPDGKCTQDTNKNGEIKCGPQIPPAGWYAIAAAAALGVGLAIYFGTRDSNNIVSPNR